MSNGALHVPPPIPQRTRSVYFLGAGFLASVEPTEHGGAPHRVHRLAQSYNLTIEDKLREAYRFFYPEEADSFVPEVVDFFSVLRAYEDASGSTDGGNPRFPGGFRCPGLDTELRLAVVRLLSDRLRQIQIPPSGWGTVDNMLRPGNVVITSNWDLFVEWYARCRNIRLRLGGWPSDSNLTLIKLHGSIDWTEPKFRKSGYRARDFAVLRELQNGRPYPIKIKSGDTLRVRAVENMGRSWQFIKPRTSRPHMIMMSQGKTVDLSPIQSMWDGAYTRHSVRRPSFALSAIHFPGRY